MKIEKFIRKHILNILLEEDEKPEEVDSRVAVSSENEQTTGPGPGRYKKELSGLKALADANPMGLMKKLNIKSARGNSKSEMIEDLLSQALKGNSEMSNVYQGTKRRKDRFGRGGVLISLTGEMSTRDSLVFIRETLKGAKNAGLVSFDTGIQAEILGDSLLAYLSKQPHRWNKPPRTKKSPPKEKETKSPPKEKETKPSQK